MKRALFVLSVSTVFFSCLSNPQQVNQDHIMDHERETNAIEYQKNPVTDTTSRGVSTTYDTTATKDTSSVRK